MSKREMIARSNVFFLCHCCHHLFFFLRVVAHVFPALFYLSSLSSLFSFRLPSSVVLSFSFSYQRSTVVLFMGHGAFGVAVKKKNGKRQQTVAPNKRFLQNNISRYCSTGGILSSFHQRAFSKVSCSFVHVSATRSPRLQLVFLSVQSFRFFLVIFLLLLFFS